MLTNLPPNLRHKYVLLVGMMIVKSDPKPNLMNLYIQQFWEESRHLYFEGIEVKFPNEVDDIKLYFTPLLVAADSKARPVLQNRLQYNGHYGCSYCYHPATYVKGAGIKYPFLDNEPQKRTHTSHVLDVQDVKKSGGTSIRGVKGYSAFSEIPTIDMVWSFSIDYLHNALLGVADQVWNNWKKILPPGKRNEIDKLLKEIQPPRDLKRTPEPISSLSVWKAIHWKAWVLYYCLTTCSTFKRIDLLEHFALFVNSMFILLQTEISKDELDICEFVEICC